MKKEAETLWAHYKYEVMMHSQGHYNLIRETLKTSEDPREIQDLIDAACEIEPTKGSILNTFDHLWGYFKKDCTTEEKEQYKHLKEEFQADTYTQKDLLIFIKEMTDKYEAPYLSQSSVIQKTFR